MSNSKLKIKNKNNIYEYDSNEISKMTKNKSKKTENKKETENNEKLNKEEFYSYESSMEYNKGYESIKQEKKASSSGLYNYNFISLSNEKNNTKNSKNKKGNNKLTDHLLNKKSNFANIQKLNIKKKNTLSKNGEDKRSPASSISGYNTSRFDKLLNKKMNFFIDKKREKSMLYNNKFKPLGLPILNINNNILFKLKNSIHCNSIGKYNLSPSISHGYKRHYGNEEKCPICISMTMKQKYLKCKNQFLFNEAVMEKLNETNQYKNIKKYIENKRKRNIKYAILKHLK